MAAKDATLSLVIVCIGLAGIYIGFIEKIWILYVGAILFTSLKSVKEVNNIAPAIWMA